jgi:TPR repeat protein
VANKGNAEAQYRLALILQSGTGIAKNEAEAAEWLNKASAQGHKGAQELQGKSADSKKEM